MFDSEKVLVIIPTHSNAGTLKQALRSVEIQTHENFEVQIIGDGSTAEVTAIAEEFSARDQRFKYRNCAKSKRKGEEYRHEAIMESEAKLITYLQDDDLFMPNHIHYSINEMRTSDFINPKPVFVSRTDMIWCIPTNIAYESNRLWHLTGDTYQNSISLTGVMHSKEAYLKLEEPWVSTPDNNPYTDLYMWRKFLSTKGLVFKTTECSRVINFLGGSNEYDENKVSQNLSWFSKITDPDFERWWDRKVSEIYSTRIAEMFSEKEHLEKKLNHLSAQKENLLVQNSLYVQRLEMIENSRTWRMASWYRVLKNLILR